MQSRLEEINATNTQVVGISYDSVDILNNFAETNDIEFPLLADPGSKTIRAYGIHNEKGLPHPGTYLVGKDRRVLAALFLEGYRERHTVEKLFEAIEKTR